MKEWSHIARLPLENPDFAMPGEIDLLLSAHVTGHLFLDESRKNSINEPVAPLTPFGWVITGLADYSNKISCRPQVNINLVQVTNPFTLERLWDENPTPPKSIYHCTQQIDNSGKQECVSCDLRKFWEQEELLGTPVPSDEDVFCEKLYAETHSRDQSGRYIVPLPFKLDPHDSLVSNKKGAIAMSISQERKFAKYPSLYTEYCKFMEEYSNLTHMSMSTQQDSEILFPHHCVWKVDPQPKLRVVFNTSNATSSKMSLNDCLCAGPKLQTDLWTVVTRARLFKVFFTADIVKMFRQILVRSEDRVWQQIIWRKTQSDAIKTYVSNTVTYGTNCAPFLAQRTLLQLASDENHRFPLGTLVIRKHHTLTTFWQVETI